MKVIQPFDKVDLAQNTGAYSQMFDVEKACFGITDQEWGFMSDTAAATVSTDFDLGMEKSWDGGANWAYYEAPIQIAADMSDGAPDYGGFNIAAPAPYVRFHIAEQNDGLVADFSLWICIP